MRVEATNAIRYNGKVHKAGSVFEIDLKTGERLFQAGHLAPTTASIREVSEERANTEKLIEKLSAPVARKGGKGKPR